MSRLRDDAGISLVEILISMTIMAVVLAATLDALDLFQRQVADETVRVDSRDQLRTTLDRLVKPLRSAVETTTGMVESAGPYDLVYESVGPTAPTAGQANGAALQRVRVCLDTATGKLYRQTKAYSDTAPALNSPTCGNTATGDYATAQLLGSNISNGSSRPVFAYDFVSGSTALKDLEGIKVSLFVDANGSRPPGEARLSTAVAMRNVNQAPIASFSDAEINGHALVNASASTDPEGGSLEYAWYVDGSANPVATDVRYDQGGLLNGSTHTFTLTVTDPGKLSDSITRTITMP